MRPDLTFIMCSFNEIGRIEDSYNDLIETLKTRKEKVEILFIDNGSTDGTREWLQKICDPDIKVIFNEKNLGKGGSVKKGIKLSNGKYVAIHDPDHEYRAADVWKSYDCAKENRAAFVLGSRVLNKNMQCKYYINYIGVWFLTLLINILYGCKLTDSATGIKVLEGDVIRKIYLKCEGFDLDFDIVTSVARVGGKILEVPAEYYPRTIAQGKKIRAFHDGSLSIKIIIKNRFVSRKSLLMNS